LQLGDIAVHHDLSLLTPAAVLALWTIVILFWLAFKRFTAVAKMKGQLPPTPVGVRGPDVDVHLPDGAKWASHNYAHLLEQPTLFYALVLILFVGGGTNTINLWLAWGYTGLRIVHSLWQVTINTVPVRFAIFLASTLCLMGLAVHAVGLTLHG
jgi:hypothetical protein